MSDKAEKSNTAKRSWFRRHKILTGVLGVIGLITIISVLSGAGDTTTTNTNNADTKKATTPKATEQPVESEKKQPDVPAEYKSALATADSYANTQHMSKKGLYDQLTSEYGEKFTKKAAQYAVDNVVTDWKANALATAKSYQEQQHMSPAAIHDQLTSEYGEKFTKAEADYAIAHLND